MYLIHHTSELLLPTGKYIPASAIKPGMQVFKGNGQRAHIKSKSTCHLPEPPMSFQIQHWPSPIVATHDQTFLSSGKHFRQLDTILLPRHDFMLPTNLDWDIPSTLQLSTSNTYIVGSYLLGYALGVAYMTYNGDDRMLVIRDPCTRKQFLKYMKMHGFLVSADAHKIYVDESTAELFDLISKGNSIPNLILAKNKEYSYGIYTGIMDVIKVNQSLSFETFKSMFVLMLLAGCFGENDIHNSQEYMYFNCNDTVSLSRKPTKDFIKLELIDDDTSSGLIVNNTVFGSL
jgi:hypothetical protein